MIKHFLILVCLLMGIQSTHAQSEATVVYIELYKKIAVQEMKRTGIPASILILTFPHTVLIYLEVPKAASAKEM